MKTTIVQLAAEDDLISVQDKISWGESSRVLLVWPWRGHPALERPLDLLLLLRHCQRIGAQLALVTQNPTVKIQAGELGIPVFKDISQAQRLAWRRPRKQPRWHLPEGRQPMKAQVLRSQQANLSMRKGQPVWLRIGWFFLGVAAVLALILFFVPSAVVRLHPARQSQHLVMGVWASPQIQSPNPSGGLPAQALDVVVEGRDQANSSSFALVPEDYATGEVQLKNLTDQVVEVPAGSGVMTLDRPPIRFVVTQAVQVPAGPGKTAVATVRAEAPGSQGNLAAGRIEAIEGPLGLRLTVQNLESTHGGTDRSTPAPSESDYQALREQLLIKLQENALMELKSQLAPGQRLLDETLRRGAVIEETRQPLPGQPGERLQLAMRVEFEAWAIQEADLQQVAKAALDANRPAGFQPVPNSMKITFASPPQLSQASAAEVGASPTTVRWQIRLERTLEAGWSDADIANALRGRTVDEAGQFLQSRLVLAGPPEISLSPSFWSRMPYLPAQIKLVRQ